MTTKQESVSIGEEGQAPVKADTLRSMLFQSKATADDLRDKLASSERMRADQANKMAAHAETIQRLHSLNELVFEMGEGVILHVRRPDEAQSYPILIPKAALQATDPSKWMSDVVDPAAKAVLAAAERSDLWIVDDPATDEKVREDHQAVREAFGLKGATCGAKAKKLVESHADLKSRHQGAATSAGLWESKAKAGMEEIEDLKDELARIRAQGGFTPAPAKPPGEKRAPLTTAEVVQRQAEAASEEARTKRAEGIQAMEDVKKAREEEKKARKVRTDARRKARAEAAAEAERGEEGPA